jgi:hypothetical protein
MFATCVAETIDALHRHRNALGIALLVGDRLGAAIAAARLRPALERARALADADAVVWAADEMIATCMPLLARAPRGFDCVDVARRERWLRGQPPDGRDDGPDVFELRANEASLDESRWAKLRVRASDLREASCRAAVFDDARLDGCDLSRANLHASSWQRAEVVHSHLSAAVLADAVLDDTRFVDCDLSGVDLGATYAPARRVTFVRCDLRVSSWRSRVIDEVRLVDCKLWGTFGAPRVERVVIERPDVSSRGDGSRIASADDVLALWHTGGAR